MTYLALIGFYLFGVATGFWWGWLYFRRNKGALP